MPSTLIARLTASWLCGCLITLPVAFVHAAEETELAKQVQNPVSDLARVGFTNTTVGGAGPNNFTSNGFLLAADTTDKFGDWALLNRLIVPLRYIPASGITEETGSSFGLGDIEYTGFLARDETKRLLKSIGGIGPTFILNTASEDRLGTGKWSVGPTVAFARILDTWVVGATVSNRWSFAGDAKRRRVNQFLLRPFVNYNFSNGWYLTSTPVIIANWDRASHDRWLVPIGGGVGKVLFRGEKRPMNLVLQGFYFIEKPELDPDWSVSLKVRILFPR